MLKEKRVTFLQCQLSISLSHHPDRWNVKYPNAFRKCLCRLNLINKIPIDPAKLVQNLLCESVSHANTLDHTRPIKYLCPHLNFPLLFVKWASDKAICANLLSYLRNHYVWRQIKSSIFPIFSNQIAMITFTRTAALLQLVQYIFISCPNQLSTSLDNHAEF